MKNFVLTFIFLLSLSSVHSQDIFYVSADNGLYARQSPDRGSKAIAKLNYGTKVTLLENTQLKLDVLDKGQIVSGQWVKVYANTPYSEIEAYVFDGYLSSEKLKPRSVVTFDNMKVAFHDLDVMEAKELQRVRMKDSTMFYSDPGVTPENKIVSIKALEHYSKLEIYQAYRTSVSINNDGPLCDLSNWKHHYSSWTPLEVIDENTFKSKQYSDKDVEKLIDVSIENLKTAVKNECGLEWSEVIKHIPSIEDLSSEIGVDAIYFKIIMTAPNGKRSEKIIAFEKPIGS